MILGIVSIQKNRAPWLAEWIAFHYLVGFRKFYIYAHCCTDQTEEILSRLSKRFDITALKLSEKKDMIQLAAYQHACDYFLNDVDWMAFIDGDEFLFSPSNINIGDALIEFNNKPISAVCAYNYNFGSSGHIMEPSGLIVENFRMRASDEFLSNRRVKSIVKGQQRISTTMCSNIFNTPHGTVDEIMRPVSWGYVPNYIPTYNKFRFNHYVCQSREYYDSFKHNSGHADAGLNAIRGEDWWSKFNTNDIYDNSLEHMYTDLNNLVTENIISSVNIKNI